MSPEEYKALGKTYTSELFNFRGNKQAAKALVKRVQDENKFHNEGQALDYILTAFEHQHNEINEFTKSAFEDAKLLIRLQQDNEKLEAELKGLRIQGVSQNSTQLRQPWLRIGEDVQNVLNTSLGEYAPTVTNEDLKVMVIDFVDADPAAEVETILEKNNALTPELGEAINALQFPLTSTLQKLYPTIFNQSNGGTEQTAGAGADTGSANQE